MDIPDLLNPLRILPPFESSPNLNGVVLQGHVDCEVCHGAPIAVTVSLVKTFGVCAPCHLYMFLDPVAAFDDNEFDQWANSFENTDEKELEALRKFSTRLRTKLASGKSLRKGDIRPRLPLWTK